MPDYRILCQMIPVDLLLLFQHTSLCSQGGFIDFLFRVEMALKELPIFGAIKYLHFALPRCVYHVVVFWQSKPPNFLCVNFHGWEIYEVVCKILYFYFVLMRWALLVLKHFFTNNIYYIPYISHLCSRMFNKGGQLPLINDQGSMAICPQFAT